MSVTILGQLYEFLIAAVVGVALGVVYDIFKVLRLVGLNFKVVVFFQDIIFFLIATITMFSYYMQITGGKFRIVSLISALLGFIIYSLTVEKIVFFIIKKIYKIISEIISFIYKKIILRLLRKIIFKPALKIGRFFKEKIMNFFKNLLQKNGKMLYNTKRIHKRKGGRRKNAKTKDKNVCKIFEF